MTKSLRRAARSTVVMVGAVFALAIVVMALFAGALAPQPPDEQNFDLIEAKPGAKALFGTDRFGRDVLSRVIYGARVSLYVAVTSIVVAMAVGGALGLRVLRRALYERYEKQAQISYGRSLPKKLIMPLPDRCASLRWRTAEASALPSCWRL